MIAWFDALPSTSDFLCAQAKAGTVRHGAAVAAARQTAGHGRVGRPFFSPTGGLYCSVYLCEERLPPAGVLPVTPRAALAVRRVLARHNSHVGIKWVNDLFREGRKAGGILAQRAGRGCVVGIGLNLHLAPGDVPDALLGIITGCAKAPGLLPARDVN